MIINKLYTAVFQIFQDYESKVIAKSLAYNSRNGGVAICTHGMHLRTWKSRG